MNHARHTGGMTSTPPWHDWRFERIPRGADDGSMASPPRGRASTGDGRADRAGDDVLLEARDRTPAR